MSAGVPSDRRRSLCRTVGPTAWAVLEELIDGAEGMCPLPVVHTNVRRLAADLGLSKDTVARALRGLLDAGLVARSSGRDPGGRFGGTTYVLDAASLGLAEAIDPPQRRARKRAPKLLQSSLFDAGEDTAS